MKCSDLRRHLAQLERPDRPPVEVRSHLVDCAGCRNWYRQLLRVERQVPRLPVPPSQRKAAFMNRVLAGDVPIGQALPGTLPFPRAGGRPHNHQKLALVTALAAGLMLFALGFYALNLKPQPKLEPGQAWVNSKMQTYSALNESGTPRERLQALKAVSEDLHNQSRDLARSPKNADELKFLAEWYRKDWQTKMLEQAQAVPIEERAGVLGEIASELDRFGKETRLLAAGMSGSSGQSLNDIGEVALRTCEDLRKLSAQMG